MTARARPSTASPAPRDSAGWAGASPARTLLLGIPLLALLASFAPRPAAARAQDPSTQETQALLDEAQGQVKTLQGLRTNLQDLLTREAELRRAIDERRRQRLELALPEAPPVAPLAGTPPVDEAKAILERLGAYEQSLTTRRALAAELDAQLDSASRIVTQLVERGRSIDTALGALAPLVDELQRRQRRGEVPAGVLTGDLDPAQLAESRKALAAELPAYEARLAALKAERDELKRQLEAIDLELAQIAGRRDTAQSRVTDAIYQADLRRDLSGRDAGTLTSLLTARLDAWGKQRRQLQDAFAQVQRTRDRLAKLDEERRKLAPPNLDELKVQEAMIESLAKAKQSVQVAEARRAFHQARKQLLDETQRLLVSIVSENEAALRQADALLKATLELEVLARLLGARQLEGGASEPTFPEGADPAFLVEETGRLRAMHGELRSRAAERTRQAAEARAALEADQAELAAIERQLPDLVRAVEREEGWARFIREVQSLDTPAVLAAYQQAEQQVGAKTREQLALRGRLDDLTGEARRIETRAQNLLDPLVQRLDLDLDQLRAKLVDELRRSVGLEPLPPTRTAQPPASASPEAPKPGTKTADLLKRAEVERTSLLSRLRFFRDRATILQELIDAERGRADIIERMIALEAERLELARRSWGAAFLLQVRVGRGEASAADLPAELADAARRDRVVRIQQELDELRQLQTAASGRIEVVRAKRDADASLTRPLEARAANLERRIRLLDERKDLEGAFELDEGELDELARRKRAQQVHARIEAEDRWYERALSATAGSELEDLDRLLEAYYQRLIDLERQVLNLDQRLARTEQLVKVTESSRTLFEETLALIRVRLAAFQVEVDVEKTRQQAMLQPSRQAELLAALKERTGVVLPPPIAIPPEEREREISRLVDRFIEPEARRLAYQAWRDRVERSLDRLGEIDSEVALHRGHTAELVAERGERKRAIARLTGGAEPLDALDDGEHPSTAEVAVVRERGEIGWLREQRLEKLIWQFGKTAGYILLIPVLALLAMSGVSMIGRRLIKPPPKPAAPVAPAMSREAEAAAAAAAVDLAVPPAPPDGGGPSGGGPAGAPAAADAPGAAADAAGSPAASGTGADAPPPPPPATTTTPSGRVKVAPADGSRQESGSGDDFPAWTPSAAASAPLEDRTQTLFTIFRAAFRALVFVLAAIYVLKAVQIDVTPLIASAGVLGLAVAFGAQSLLKDFFVGFFILLENQYNVGDIVTINGVGGRVERINLRLTVLRDVEGIVHFIPNGTIQAVSNRTKAWAQAKLELGVSYKTMPDEVISCLQRVCRRLTDDPVFGAKILQFEVPGVENFADNAVIYRVHVKCTPGDQWLIAREFRRRVRYAFEREGIEIPFPQRVVHMVSPREEG